MLADAVRSFAKTVELRPEDPRAPTRMAWILATAADAGLRDGPRAVRLAERAATDTERQDPFILDVLAAGYAETGEFRKAVQTSREAFELAKGDEELRADIRRHFDSYRRKRAWRTGAE